MGFIAAMKGLLGMDYEDEYYEDELVDDEAPAINAPPVKKKQPRLLKFPSPRDKSIYTLQPTSYEDATTAADYLKAGSAVFLNLQNIEPNLGRRMVDVLSGVCYGVDGHSHKVGEKLFLFLPPDFFITSDEKTHLESQGLFLNGFRDLARQGATPIAGAVKGSTGADSLERGNLFSFNS